MRVTWAATSADTSTAMTALSALRAGMEDIAAALEP